MINNTIVIIEDEAAIADTLIHVIEAESATAKWFSTAGDGLDFIKHNHADLVVLDVGLPDANGFDVCKSIREFSHVPIIFLTARNDEIDRVVGLEIGADDYVTKPFSPREMVARIKLRLRTVQTTAAQLTSQLVAKNFDYQYNGIDIGLTALEFKLLNKLIAHPEQVFSREQLMTAGDMPLSHAYERNIDTHIKSIRYKLKHQAQLDCIKTKRGFGYFFKM